MNLNNENINKLFEDDANGREGLNFYKEVIEAIKNHGNNKASFSSWHINLRKSAVDYEPYIININYSKDGKWNLILTKNSENENDLWTKTLIEKEFDKGNISTEGWNEQEQRFYKDFEGDANKILSLLNLKNDENGKNILDYIEENEKREKTISNIVKTRKVWKWKIDDIEKELEDSKNKIFNVTKTFSENGKTFYVTLIKRADGEYNLQFSEKNDNEKEIESKLLVDTQKIIKGTSGINFFKLKENIKRLKYGSLEELAEKIKEVSKGKTMTDYDKFDNVLFSWECDTKKENGVSYDWEDEGTFDDYTDFDDFEYE